MKSRPFRISAACSCWMLAIFAMANRFAAGEPPSGQLISPIGSERATSGAGNKIVTFGKKSHVVWQDADESGNYFNRTGSYDHTTGQWTEPFTLNRGRDNHARPVVAVDAEGYLHVILSGHNSPATYRRSVRPNDATEFTEGEPAGRGTYPVVTAAADGTLLMTMRSASRWNGVDLYIRERNKPWRVLSKLLVRDPKLPGYAGYQNGIAWGPKRRKLHMVFDFYESKHTYKGRGVHQAVCYMQSPDGGRTWQKADGTLIELPARPEQMDILARDTRSRAIKMPPPVLLAQGCLVVDSAGLPHILYVSHLEEPGRVVHASADAAGQWKQQKIGALHEAYPQLRPTGCRGALTIDAEDQLHALLELKPLGSGWVDGKPTRGMMFAEEDKRLVWLTSADRGRTFSTEAALPAGRIFNQANVERPAGFNRIAAGRRPPFVYFDGKSRYRKKGEVLQNNVFFVPASPAD